jgi:predicted RecB family nuclease
MPPAPPLSKSRFIAGTQCHKQLWWRVHEPDAPELSPDPGLRHRFEQGLHVGRTARRYVGDGTGELIDLPVYQFEERIAATNQALQRNANEGPRPLFEATFVADSTYAQINVLDPIREISGGENAFSVVEVKATNRLKQEHILDVALQVHVARKSGVRVERAEVMHLNAQCRFPDLSNLFVREDITPVVEGVLFEVPVLLSQQLQMLDGPLPEITIGDHCRKPYDCPFVERCWKLPQHHVSTLYRIPRKQVEDYEAQGFETIHDLPSDVELGVIHARQVKAVRSGQLVVEPTLPAALRSFTAPLAYLDFETVSLAIPVWDGCKPWEMVPAQFSCHVESGRDRFAHHSWIAQGPEDPRPLIAQRVVDACRGARKVVAYFANFERDCIRRLALAVPHLAGELTAVEQKLVDLLPLVRNHLYHPDFDGSFSIKRVLPALVPGLSYNDLAIGDGELASVELLRLMFEGDRMPAAERATLRQSLERYCERDTWAMVKLWERIRGLVGGQLELF